MLFLAIISSVFKCNCFAESNEMCLCHRQFRFVNFSVASYRVVQCIPFRIVQPVDTVPNIRNGVYTYRPFTNLTWRPARKVAWTLCNIKKLFKSQCPCYASCFSLVAVLGKQVVCVDVVCSQFLTTATSSSQPSNVGRPANNHFSTVALTRPNYSPFSAFRFPTARPQNQKAAKSLSSVVRIRSATVLSSRVHGYHRNIRMITLSRPMNRHHP